MRMPALIGGRKSSLPRRRFAKSAIARRLEFEAMEPRHLLAGQGFLQGVAFIDGDGDNVLDAEEVRKQDATIQLFQEVGGVYVPHAVTPSTTTDADGYYLFENLDPGNYRIVEAASPLYDLQGVQILSQLNPATPGPGNSIDVTIVDPTTVSVLLDTDDINPWEEITFDFFVGEDFGGEDIIYTVGAMPVTVSRGVHGPVNFETYCVNLVHLLEFGINDYPVEPNPDPVADPPDVTLYNWERVAYLYNHYGTQSLSSTDAAALQVAIWELLYDAVPDFDTGNFKDVQRDTGGITDPAEFAALKAQAEFYLADSEGKSEYAIYLDASMAEDPRQSVIATGSYNFANTARPDIKIKKFTNGEDADTEEDAPLIAPGDVVTWTYHVTNTGGLPFVQAEVLITDDNGTPGDLSDDFSTGSGDVLLDPSSDSGSDGILSPGETWTYIATGIAEDLGASSPPVTFNLGGATALDGPDGNVRTYAAGGISVNVSGFSRDKTTGDWSAAWLGAYGGGVGVTDSSEGSGGSNSHTVDNIGRDNYVLFEFSEDVVIDAAFLGYVVGDSDLSVWIGSATDPFDNHLALSDALLAGLGFTEVNTTTLTSARLADLNNGGVAGNVLVIAARTGDANDKFKIETLKVRQHACYENFAYVTTGPGGPADSDVSHYCNPEGTPGIDIEKYTNGVDAESEEDAPEIAPGATVTWTYKVTNTGSTAFASGQVVVTDDNGTPGVSGDDFQPVFDSVLIGDGDTLLEPGEAWIYKASAAAQDLGGSGAAVTFNLEGNTALDGANGNVRTYSAGGVSVNVSAFSRDKASGAWSSAWLGAYGGGVGVTDASEGYGSGNSHTVDNNGRDNYVLFEFSEKVVVDAAFLGYVVGDSDLTVWIGSTADPFNNHLALSDAVLAGLGFTEVNATTLTGTRLADLNAGNISGNVLVIAARTGEANDYFKIETLKVRTHACYENFAVVTTGPGGPTDSDASYYCNPEGTPGIKIKKFTNGVDADTPAEAPAIPVGNLVTWTYKVTNTGTTVFTAGQVVVKDDNGTPSYAADDFAPAFDAALSTGLHDGDTLLEPGETWVYKATATAEEIVAPGSSSTTFNLTGSSSTDGADGNVRTYTSGGVSVKVSGFSRDKGTGAWTKAYVGAYSSGLGVTDSSEGSGGNNMHMVDNVGRDNYVLFEFSEKVVVDAAFLGYVVNDSDLTVWIGSTTDPFNNHLMLSDSVLAGLGFTEVNLTDLASARTADLNAGGFAGNVLVIAGWTKDSTPDDRFKIKTLTVKQNEPGVYRNMGKVTAGGVSDDDPSHYRNPTDWTKFYVVDSSADDMFEYGQAGKTLSNNNLAGSNTNPRGVATTSAGNKVWVIDANKVVYVYNADGQLLGSWTAYGLTAPEDITTNGTDVWIVDDGANKVFRFAGAASRLGGGQSPASSFALNYANGNAKGIVTSGSHFWVVNDNTTDKVFKYTMGGSLVGAWTIDSRNGSPTGITIDPTDVNHVWIVDSADDAVYRYSGATAATYGSRTADSVFKLASANCLAQGIADPPPGWSGSLDISAELVHSAPASAIVAGQNDWIRAAAYAESSAHGVQAGLRAGSSARQRSFASTLPTSARSPLADLEPSASIASDRSSFADAADKFFEEVEITQLKRRAARGAARPQLLNTLR